MNHLHDNVDKLFQAFHNHFQYPHLTSDFHFIFDEPSDVILCHNEAFGVFIKFFQKSAKIAPEFFFIKRLSIIAWQNFVIFFEIRQNIFDVIKENFSIFVKCFPAIFVVIMKVDWKELNQKRVLLN